MTQPAIQGPPRIYPFPHTHIHIYSHVYPVLIKVNRTFSCLACFPPLLFFSTTILFFSPSIFFPSTFPVFSLFKDLHCEHKGHIRRDKIFNNFHVSQVFFFVIEINQRRVCVCLARNYCALTQYT